MKRFLGFLFVLFAIVSCRKDPSLNLGDAVPYAIQYPERLGKYLPPLSIPQDNPMTVEGVELGDELVMRIELRVDRAMGTCT